MALLKVNEKLNFVVPVYADDNETIIAYVHSMPISREVFEAHFLLLSKTWAAIYAEGLGPLAGPRVASLMLHEVAKKMNDPHSALSLMNEVRRLTTVMTREHTGWVSIPFQDAADHKMLNEDDLSEVTNGIVFFTLASAMHRKKDLNLVLTGAAQIWGAQISSLDSTAFASSLVTSTTVGDTTRKHKQASSVPF